MGSPHKGTIIRSYDVSLVLTWTVEPLRKQFVLCWGLWCFETLWRSCDIANIARTCIPSSSSVWISWYLVFINLAACLRSVEIVCVFRTSPVYIWYSMLLYCHRDCCGMPVNYLKGTILISGFLYLAAKVFPTSLITSPSGEIGCWNYHCELFSFIVHTSCFPFHI